jgi:Domain of unknown function (DUF1876)
MTGDRSWSRGWLAKLEPGRRERDDTRAETPRGEAMSNNKQWRVEILIDEHTDQRRTRAEARLHNPGDTGLIGEGLARRSPWDAEVPEIGDELAVSRALSDLAHKLLEAAAGDIEQSTHRAAHLTR